MFIKSHFIPEEIFNRFLYPVLKDKPISIFNDYIPTQEEISLNPYNILILNEPNELFGLHDIGLNYSSNFSCILTWSDKILKNCSNSLLFPFGMSSMWETPELYEKLNISSKQLNVFFVCGPKNQIKGHHFRHRIYNLENKIQIPHNWIFSCAIEDKNKNFKNSMFHVAVENTQQNNLFTEKIIDAFLTKTVPIYWGCLNIGDFFDEQGIIKFNNEEELVNIVSSLTEKDYFDRKEAIEYNYNIALHWSKYFERLTQILEDIVKLNNI